MHKYVLPIIPGLRDAWLGTAFLPCLEQETGTGIPTSPTLKLFWGPGLRTSSPVVKRPTQCYLPRRLGAAVPLRL